MVLNKSQLSRFPITLATQLCFIYEFHFDYTHYQDAVVKV